MKNETPCADVGSGSLRRRTIQWRLQLPQGTAPNLPVQRPSRRLRDPRGGMPSC